jgi:hypothetical protein
MCSTNITFNKPGLLRDWEEAMITVEITVRSEGKTIASNLMCITENSIGHDLDIPVLPTVIQEAEYAHDEQLTLHGLRATVEGIVSSNKRNDMLATGSKPPQQPSDAPSNATSEEANKI